jgi:polysaccharide biosynthesis/export protein
VRLLFKRYELVLLVCMVGVLGVVSKTSAQQPTDYTLHAGDQVEVAVWKEPDLTRTVVVRPDGKFSFPLAGEISALARTVQQVSAEIEQKLKKYIPEPVVTVTVMGIEGNKVYVIGQVNKPGAYVMNPQIDVLQALSVAGGTTAFAALNDIKVLRKGREGQRVFAFRFDDVSKGRNLEQNITLESGDVVIVP